MSIPVKYRYHQIPFGGKLAEGISDDLLVKMFYSMLRIRRIEEAIEGKYHENEMKTPIHLVIGQEATSVGACEAMRKEDLIFSSHRTHGNYLAKGGDLNAMMSEFFCKSNGCAGSRGGSMHLFDKSVGMAGSSAICGGAAPIATGHALTAKFLNKDYVTTVFFGDGASEEGSLWETLNFAALKKLPVVYFLENNFYSVCSPLDRRQPEGVEIYKKAQAFGVNSTLVDGTNVLHVYDATKKAIEKARAGHGPQFIEAKVYRWRAHGGSGDDLHLGYRNADEGKDWHQYCPIETYQKYLVERGLMSPQKREEMEKQIEAECKSSFEFARNSPEPTEQDLYTYVYAN